MCWQQVSSSVIMSGTASSCKHTTPAPASNRSNIASDGAAAALIILQIITHDKPPAAAGIT